MDKEHKTNFTNFRLGNFKAFSNPVDFPIRPITLLFGPNSSGKSAFLKSLLLLKQSLTGEIESRLYPNGNLVTLGYYEEFVHNHDNNKFIDFTININIQNLPQQLDIERNSPVDKLSFICDSYKTIGISLSYDKSYNSSSIEFYLGDEDIPFIKYYDFEKYDFNSNHSFWHFYWEHFDKKDNNKSLLKILDRIIEHRSDYNEKEHSKSRSTNKEYREYLESYQKEIESLKSIREEPDRYTQALNIYWVHSDMYFLMGLNENKDGGKFFKDMINDSGYQKDPLLIFSLIIYAIKQSFKNFYHIGALRAAPERYYSYDRNFDNFSNIFDPDEERIPRQLFTGEEMPHKLFADKSLIQHVNEILKKLGSPYEIKISEFVNKDLGVVSNSLFSVNLYNTESGCHNNLSDVGFGFSQLLPVIVKCCLASGHRRSAETIMIEQPELHLHPAMQAKLGDLFINTALTHKKNIVNQQGILLFDDDEVKGIEKDKHRNNSLIIETHSEHLILRILRRIRETTEGRNESTPPIYPEDVSVIYIKPGKDGSKVMHLPITEDGDFETDWPDGFFDERARELF